MSKPTATTLRPRVPASLVQIASQLLIAVLCVAVLVYGLLPGLLAVCVGYLLTAGLTRWPRVGHWRLPSFWAATLVILMPIVALGFLMANAKGVVFGAVTQYQALLRHLAGTVLEIRQKLPPDLASHLPDELATAQTWLAAYLQSQAHALTGLGSAGLHGGLLVYVGLVIGALIVGTPSGVSAEPLRVQMRTRATHFMESFRQIVIAQFWIAAFNAVCTAIFLMLALPQFGVNIPYASSLVALTFFAGLIPIVGNLLCNSVLTLAGVSISPAVGLACLLFLVSIHKFEYFINAKVVGSRTGTSAWELLTVMFVGEAIFGVAGLVAAPLYYAYAKRELQAQGLI